MALYAYQQAEDSSCFIYHSAAAINIALHIEDIKKLS